MSKKNKRQKIRYFAILLSLILFPITIFYLSPVLILEGAWQGVVTGSALVFAALFVSSLFLGRGFCGWVCPGAFLFETLFVFNNRKVIRGNSIKFILWIPWMIAILSFFYLAGGILRVDPLFQIDYGISMSRVQNFIVYYGFIALFFILSLAVGRRSFCHHVCWMAPFMITGRWIRNRFRWPSLQLASIPSTCTHCHNCTEECPMSLPVEEMVAENRMENLECILCGNCVDRCKSKSIRYRFWQ